MRASELEQWATGDESSAGVVYDSKVGAASLYGALEQAA